MPDLFLDYDCIETSLQRKMFLKRLTNYDLLIIDEWLGNSLREKHHELVMKRTEVHSTIFCGQFNPRLWYEVLYTSSETEAILNRIFWGALQSRLWRIQNESITLFFESGRLRVVLKMKLAPVLLLKQHELLRENIQNNNGFLLDFYL